MPACSRFAKNHGGHGTAVASGAGGEAPGRTSHYSREAVLGLSYHDKHLVARVGQAAAAGLTFGMNPRMQGVLVS